MIRKLYVKNFQGVGEANFRLAPTTALVGPNGSGKTSLAEAIEYALLGTAPRGGTLAEVIRQGADAAEVELILDDADRTTLGRRQTPSTATRTIDGEKASDKAFDAAVSKHVGDPRAIRAALRSGGLLELNEADLQRFLSDLTRAKLDSAAIAHALGDDVRAAAKRLGLRLPSSLEEFADRKVGRTTERGCESLAVERRQAAKRVLAEREADLARLPVPAIDSGERRVDELEAELRQARADHQAAVRAEEAAGADARARREERIAQLCREVEAADAALREAMAAEGPAKERRSQAVVEKLLADARRRAADAEARAALCERTIARTEKLDPPRPGDEDLVTRLPALQKALQDSRRVLDEATRADDTLRRQYLQAKGELADAPAGGTCSAACEHCTVARAAAYRAELQVKLDDFTTRGKAAAKRCAEAHEASEQADQAEAEAEAASRRVNTAAALATAREEVDEARREAATERASEKALVAELDDLKAARAAAEVTRAKSDALKRAREALAAARAEPLPEPPATTSAALAERVAGGEQFVEAAQARDARARALAAVETARAEVEATDLVAKALGKDGVRSELVAAGVEPFTRAANEALTLFAPGWRVAVSPDPFGIVLAQGDAVFRPEQLSDGHRTRLLFVLQYAVAMLSGVRLVVFDRVELLDDDGRRGLDQLLVACAEGELQVLLLTCDADRTPQAVEGLVNVYRVGQGGVGQSEKAVGARVGAEGRA